MKTKLALLLAFLVTHFFTTAWAAEVVIPDAALKAAIWETLGRPAPVGILTEQDMLNLRNLDLTRDCDFGGCAWVRVLDGLGAAHNLLSLNLRKNHLTSVTLPPGLTSLTTLVLAENLLTSLTFPPELTNLATLSLSGNPLSDFSFLSEMTHLTTLDLGGPGSELTSLTLPPGLTNLLLSSIGERLTNYSFLGGLTNLTTLYLCCDPRTNLTLPTNLTTLTTLSIYYNNELMSLTLPTGLTNLTILSIDHNNQLTNLTLPADLTSLTTLDLGRNQLMSVTLPPGLTSLKTLYLGDNPLTSLILSGGLTNLTTLNLFQSTSPQFTLSGDVSHLTSLNFGPPGWCGYCKGILMSLTLPASLTSLTTLNLDGNPFQSLVLPEPLAVGALAGLVSALRAQGVSVSIYLPTLRLVALPRTIEETFEFLLTGPPGTYRLQVTRDFSTWTELDPVSIDENESVKVADPSANARLHSFYRAVRSIKAARAGTDTGCGLPP